MSDQKIGIFIQQLRKEKNLTQKDLADQLNITDKAVSKWERGLSCPDISLLIPLTKILEVSTSELLNGEKTKPINEYNENTEIAVKKALNYSDKTSKEKLEKIRFCIFVIISFASFIAIFTCFICDFAISKSLSWSFIVAASVTFGWLLLFPLLRARRNILRNFCLVLSITIVPYLLILGYIIEVPLVYTLGSALSAVSIITLWASFLLFDKLRHKIWRAFGIFFLIALTLTLCINHIVNYFIQQNVNDPINDFINSICLITLSIICFGIDYYSTSRRRKEL